MIWFIAGFVTGGMVGLVSASIFAAAGNPDQYAEGWQAAMSQSNTPEHPRDRGFEVVWDDDDE